MSKFLPTNEFKWIDPKDFDSKKYSSNNFKRCVLEVALEYHLELCENLVADKIEIKK